MSVEHNNYFNNFSPFNSIQFTLAFHSHDSASLHSSHFYRFIALFEWFAKQIEIIF